MPSTVKNATLLFMGRAVVRAQALLGDPAARLLGMSPTRDPYPVYESVRRQGVLVPTRMGLYLTASHELCSSLLRDPGFGSLSGGALSPVDS